MDVDDATAEAGDEAVRSAAACSRRGRRGRRGALRPSRPSPRRGRCDRRRRRPGRSPSRPRPPRPAPAPAPPACRSRRRPPRSRRARAACRGSPAGWCRSRRRGRRCGSRSRPHLRATITITRMIRVEAQILTSMGEAATGDVDPRGIYVAAGRGSRWRQPGLRSNRSVGVRWRRHDSWLVPLRQVRRRRVPCLGAVSPWRRVGQRWSASPAAIASDTCTAAWSTFARNNVAAPPGAAGRQPGSRRRPRRPLPSGSSMDLPGGARAGTHGSERVRRRPRRCRAAPVRPGTRSALTPVAANDDGSPGSFARRARRRWSRARGRRHHLPDRRGWEARR